MEVINGLKEEEKEDVFHRRKEAGDQEKLSVGVAYLFDYVRDNYLGPPTAPERDQNPAGGLDINDDVFTSRSRNVEALRRAKVLLVDENTKRNPVADWWALRVLNFWADGLAELHSELKTQSMDRINAVSNSEFFSALDSNQKALFWIEASHVFSKYYEYEASQKALLSALELTGIRLDYTGAMGKRTKFQTKEVAQLILDLKRSRPLTQSDLDWGTTPKTPHACLLNDDTLLENPVVGEAAEDELSPVEQLCLLSSVILIRRTCARTELLDRELLVCLAKVLQSPTNWALQSSALLNRCELEKGEYRRVERSLKQSEELDNQFARIEPSFHDRFSPITFGAEPPSIWRIQSLQAELLRKLGCTREALGIFEKLEAWDEVIECYKSLGSLEQAERIVRDRLAETETPRMLCYLGDITMNVEHYEKAWALSGERSARAQRSLANLWLNRKQFTKAKDCFERSLAIEPLQLSVWYNLGYCGMQMEDYETAARAYHRCAQLEPDNFEAWNNLSAAYVRLHQKDRAHKILQEALKFNYENWKVWDNFMVVSVDTGNYSDALKAYHRLLDLRDKHSDVEVLKILSTVCREGPEKLCEEAKKLFGRITSKTSNEPEIWRAYAVLSEPTENQTDAEQLDKFVHILQRAHQSGFQNKRWEAEVSECEAMISVAVKLAQTQLKQALMSPEQEAQRKGSARMTIRSVLSGVKRRYPSESSLQTQIQELERVLEDLKE